jgi:beta-lactamase class A
MSRFNRVKRRKSYRVIFFLALLCIISGLSLFAYFWSVQNQASSLQTPERESRELMNPSTKPKKEKSVKLEDMVTKVMQGEKGKYGIVIFNFKTNEYYFSNETSIFKSASLYKLWVMAVTYEQIKLGKLHSYDMLARNQNSLYKEFNLATVSAEIQTQPDDVATPALSKPKVLSMTIDQALQKMITLSDNDAALLLTDRVTLKNISDFLRRNVFLQSKIGDSNGYPVTTAFDIALYLKKLNAGELADVDTTQRMLTLLKQQRLNGKIPKYLPDEITIAHKTGELDSVTHDAGIVYTPKGNYIEVVMTDTDNPPAAVEKIAELSRQVYNYFSTE